jgi:hypothetical protein
MAGGIRNDKTMYTISTTMRDGARRGFFQGTGERQKEMHGRINNVNMTTITTTVHTQSQIFIITHCVLGYVT